MNVDRATLVRFAPAVLLALLTVAVRLDGIGEASITQDESTMILFAEGVIERGYPFLYTRTGEFVSSTYELVPYPIALSISLFGFSELSVRLPAVLFSVGTVLALLAFATRLFDRRIGWLAAATYAVLPWAIHWGQNGFYPAQVQLLALLLMISAHRVFYDEEPQPRWIYATALFAVLMYLTWEGAGLLLPAMGLIALTLRWWKWPWLSNLHAWAAGSLLLLCVIGQLTYRTLLRTPFRIIGAGRSSVSFSQLAYTEPDFDPLYYLDATASEAHLFLGVAFLLGVLLLHRNANLRYLYAIVLYSLLMFTAMLGYYAPRYAYFLLPPFLIAASAAVMLVSDELMGRVPRPRLARVGGWLLAGGLATSQLLLASPWGVRPVKALDALKARRPYELRIDQRGFSFRPIVEALAERHRQGDVVIAQAPFPMSVYSELKGDYFLQSITVTGVVSTKGDLPAVRDRWIRNPVLRSLDELKDVMQRNPRVWFALTPTGHANLDPELYAFLTSRMELVRESSAGRLYLWVNPDRATRKPV